MNARTPKFSHSWKLLLAELVVVFLGVYGAFWVDNFRDERDRDERTLLVVLALQQDLSDYADVSIGFSSFVERGLQDWQDAMERGEMPAPFVFRIYGAEKPPVSTWDVVRQSELAALLDASPLYELGFFYNELSGYGDRYVRYAEFTESTVLPLLKVGNSSFYTKDGQKLLPRFAAHMDRLREHHDFMLASIGWAICLRDRLENSDVDTATCRTEVGITPM
jgi:hypothetical protein